LLKAESKDSFLERLSSDHAKIESIHGEAKSMLVEAESRLEMIEAAAARGGSLTDSEVALKKLASRAAQLPLALEAAVIQEQAARELDLPLEPGNGDVTAKEKASDHLDEGSIKN
jgi:hypothetical protein